MTPETVLPRRLFSALPLGAVLVLSMGVALVALGSGSGYIALPFEMALVDQRLPVIFRVHMLASAMVLILLPFAFALRFRPELHRKMGWTLGAFVVAGGLTALPVAIFSYSSFVARAGFFVQGIVWLALFGSAISAIRRGDRARHAALMLAMAAVTTGAVWFRLLTGSAILLDLPFEPVYAASAWIAWLAPLALVRAYDRELSQWALRRPGVRPALARKPSMG